ncbi:MAG: hypothetical protein EON58_02010 [Alphaproteobacteria bacterium]|nr:MAG: hypothetical protein EON58_02010 [Alphaproteobacteria bacterium]
MKGTVRQGFALAVLESREDWRQANSGTHSLKELRRMGHPYARAATVHVAREGRAAARSAGKAYAANQRGAKPGAKAKLPTDIINRQSGRLYGSFRLRRREEGGKLIYTAESTAIYWRYVRDGTEKMVARRVAETIARNHKARMAGLRRRAQF